ncbi:hypothetical protein DN402_10105 [Streptomyces sp. SW4]|nr:hypothetical protein DN402_10105 [Streptomyces sp. SW4]
MRYLRLLTAALCAAALTGCGSSDDEGLSYPAPDSICGVPADKEVLESLLDDGDKLEQDDGGDTLADGQFCHLYVDGNDSVTSDGDWHERDYELRDYFQDYEVKNLRYLKGGEYASWNSGVVMVAPVPGSARRVMCCPSK